MPLAFTCELKLSPSDFIVREIDLNGTVCDLTCFDLPVEKIKESENVAIKEENEESNMKASIKVDKSLYTLQEMDEYNDFIEFGKKQELIFYNNDAPISTEVFIFNTSFITAREDRKNVYRGILDLFPFFRNDINSFHVIDEEGENIKQTQCIVRVNSYFFNLKSILPTHDDLKLFMKFINEKSHIDEDKNTHNKSNTLVLPSYINDKGARGNVHQEIAKNYKFCKSSTNSNNQITISLKNSGKRKRLSDKKEDRRNNKYLKFVLRKEGCEQFNAVYKVADSLGISTNSVTFSGIKDKNAITYQNIVLCDNDLTAADLIKATKHLEPFIQIGNITYSKKPLTVGELYGNKFEIILRNLVFVNASSCESFDKTIEKLKMQGFINFYGEQRTGKESCEIKTYQIGIELLKLNFQKVIQLLFTPTSTDGEIFVKAKTMFNENNIKGALQAFPKKATVETTILKAIRRLTVIDESSSTAIKYDAKEVLNQLPYSQKTLFVNSYQSHVWNKVARERVKRYGFSVTIGDLIMDEDNCNSIVEVDEHNVSSLQEKNIVLPLPGYKIIYPKNMIDYYILVLKEDGLNLESMKENVESKGAYRRLIEIPSGLEYKLIDTNLHISFSLHSGCYATTCISELQTM